MEMPKAKLLLGEHSILKTPELIKIKTIKKKHMEQIKDVNNLGERALHLRAEELDVIGLCDYWIVFWHNVTGRLYKCHQTDYIQYIAWFAHEKNNADPKLAIEDAHILVRTFPQIFED